MMKYDCPINARIPAELVVEVKQLAKKEGWKTLSDALRVLLTIGLNRKTAEGVVRRGRKTN